LIQSKIRILVSLSRQQLGLHPHLILLKKQGLVSIRKETKLTATGKKRLQWGRKQTQLPERDDMELLPDNKVLNLRMRGMQTRESKVRIVCCESACCSAPRDRKEQGRSN